MTSKTGYAFVSVGSLLTFGGMLKMLTTVGSVTLVIAWGLVALLGIFVLMIGTKKVLTASGTKARARPENAPGKTDSWLRRQ